MILVTGATGFVGNLVAKQLLAHDLDVIASVRTDNSVLPAGVQRFVAGDFAKDINWLPALSDVDVVIHIAARAHVMNDTAVDPLAEFRKVNMDGTLDLARQAAEAGVKRFVFISSIKVNGEMTSTDQPFKSDDTFIPIDPYGRDR